MQGTPIRGPFSLRINLFAGEMRNARFNGFMAEKMGIRFKFQSRIAAGLP